MQTVLEPVKNKPARKSAKPRGKVALSADEYLRSNRANETALSEAIKAAERGELVQFDPRKR